MKTKSAMGKTTQSCRPAKRSAAGKNCGRGHLCRVTVNALPDLHFTRLVCSPGSAQKTKSATGNDAVLQGSQAQRRRQRTAARTLLFRVTANAFTRPTFKCYLSPRGALQKEDEARDGKHDEILSAPSSRNSCKRKPRSRQTRPGFFYRYPARLTAFEDLKAEAMGVLRVGVMKLAEHRLPFVRIVIREMGIAFHFHQYGTSRASALSAGTAHTPGRRRSP